MNKSDPDIGAQYFRYLEFIQKYYKDRDNKASLNKCIKYCQLSIEIFPEFKSWWIKEYGKWDNLSVPCFKQLAIIYEKQEKYDQAIEICKKALSYGLDDGTKHGYNGRISKLEKKKDRPKPPKKDKLKNITPDIAENSKKLLEKNINLRQFNDWYVSISFNRSTSNNFLKAIALAKASDQYIETVDRQNNKIYQAVYSSNPESYLKFIQLYELINSWKSCFVILNGKIVDRKIIGGINYCYGDKIRSGNKNFCFGASEYTDNPFGCHRLQVSAFNHPWWSFGMYDRKGIWHINKSAILERIEQNSIPYRRCPAFDYERILSRLKKLPDTLNPNTDKDWEFETNGVHPKGMNDGSMSIEIKCSVDDLKNNKKNSGYQKNHGCLTSVISCLSLVVAAIYFFI